MDMIQTIQKWGNGTGIRLPKKMLLKEGLGIGQQMSLEVQDGNVILKPVKEKPPITINSLLKGVTPEQVGGEMYWGADLGNELYE